MPKLELSRQISLGNVITLVALLASVAGSWAQMNYRVSAIEDRTEILADVQARQSTRIRNNEVGVAVQDTRWASIETTLSQINRHLERIDERLIERHGSP